MKPIYLSIKGLNSFSECVEIDFTKLTQSGIFGIFGDTGSGKSSILDGINFALYGNVGRSKEKTDIINYNCDSVEVKFIFNVLSCGIRKNYTIERRIKRTGTHSAFLYEEDENGINKQIAENVKNVKEKVIEIIGVSADDFRKCIALPQGEFAEFVQSEPSKRVELIERLFNLSKYGERLRTKLSERKNSVENEFQKTKGEMLPYENITDEQTKQIELEIIETREVYAALESERESYLNTYNEAAALYNEKRLLDDAELNLELLSKQSEEMEKLRKNLELLPECRRVCDEEKYKAEVESKIAAERTRLIQVDADINSYELLVKNVEEELRLFNYQQKIDDWTEKMAKLSAAQGKFNELKGLNEKLKTARREVEEIKKKREEQVDKFNTYQSTLEGLKTELLALPELRIESLLSDDVKNSIAEKFYKDEYVYLSGLLEKVYEYESNTELYDFILREINQRLEYLKEILSSVSVNAIDVNQRLKELQLNLEKRQNFSARISKGEQLLSACRGEINILDEKINQRQVEIEANLEKYNQLLAELSSEYGNNLNYEFIRVELYKQKKVIDNENERLNKQCEQGKLKLSALYEEKKNRLKYIEQRSAEAEEKREKISDLLKTIGLVSAEQCKKLLEEFGDFEKASKKLDEYDRSITSYNAIIEQHKNKKGIREITEEKVNAAKKQIDELEKSMREKNGEIKVKENELNSIRLKLARKKEISNLLKQITEQRNLLGQLDSLISGNKFMKFVADGHLGEISKVASKMLLDLTDGRYFLVYKADNFFVGDNYNGGEQRGVNTLSGGETFLVSLSLALALSGVICARSDKDIEFFFLDEGFGTLDDALIEVVMGALEKLKNSNFTIGIISHVEELKHRIESKIIVNKATESHGSTVALIC